MPTHPSLRSSVHFLPLLLLVAGSDSASPSNVHVIRNAGDLIELSENVVSGTVYSGTTVYLDSDIDFSDEPSSQFTPIGNFVTDMHFNGTFDGQGHTISNINITSSSDGIGLFEFSYGDFYAKNFVMDSSCSFTCNHTSENLYNPSVGSIAGALYSYYGPCTVESVVNMATVSYTGSVIGSRSYTLIGGFAGLLSYYHAGDIIMRNCVNYGTVAISGVSSSAVYAGGIVGQVWGKGSIITTFVQNCLNYGTIIYSGTTDNLYVGGISGENTVVSFTNCVGAGRIEMLSRPKVEMFGGIVGSGMNIVEISHCFWTSDTGCVNASASTGSLSPDSSLITINSTTVNELNEYASSNNWNKWLLNTNNASVSFKVDNGAKDTTFSSQLILLPDLAGDGNETRFSGWHKDTGFLEPLSEYEVSGDTEFYSTYGAICKVVFDGNGGDVTSPSKVVKVDEEYGSLPSANRTGHTFIGWFTGVTDGEQVTSEVISSSQSDQTLYAHWTANNYTLTFDYNNGTEPLVLEVPYDSPIEYPVTLYRRGASFTQWDKDLRAMPAHNLTVTAEWVLFVYQAVFDFGNGTKQTVPLRYGEAIPYPDVPEQDGYIFEWTPRPKIMPDNRVDITGKWVKVSKYVKITFATKDLSEEEANAIITKYTDDKFEIEMIDTKGSFVIIRFVDATEATKFVRKVSDSSNELIRGVDILSNYSESFSFGLYPRIFLFCSGIHYSLKIIFSCILW